MMDWLNKEWDFPVAQRLLARERDHGHGRRMRRAARGAPSQSACRRSSSSHTSMRWGRWRSIAREILPRLQRRIAPRAPPLDLARQGGARLPNTRKMFWMRLLRRDRNLNGERVGRRGTKYRGLPERNGGQRCSARLKTTRLGLLAAVFTAAFAGSAAQARSRSA